MASSSSSLGTARVIDRHEAKVGDIFKFWTGSQSISRAWHFRLQDEESRETAHKIVFRHNVATGSWVIVLDGKPFMNGFEPIINRKFEITFMIEDHYSSVISANGTSGVRYSHRLIVQDKEINEIKRSMTESLSVGEQIPEHVSIPDSRSYSDGTKEVTLYQIFIKLLNGSQIIVERRFSEFVFLRSILMSQKDQLIDRIPVLPGRVCAPWTDQLSSTFINDRRIALEVFLLGLLANPRVRHYTEVFCFLGLDPITGSALLQPMSSSLMFSDDDEEEEGFPP